MSCTCCVPDGAEHAPHLFTAQPLAGRAGVALVSAASSDSVCDEFMQHTSETSLYKHTPESMEDATTTSGASSASFIIPD